MLSYFTQPAPVLPQNQPQFYKFKIGETVRIDASPRERKSLNFKYSLNRGNKTLMGLKNFYLFMEWMLTGKLQNNVVGVIRTRKLLTKKNQIFPFYTVYIEKLDQVINSFLIFFSLRLITYSCTVLSLSGTLLDGLSANPCFKSPRNILF